jgi:tRNA pseudouridine38/39 synthase
VLWKALNKGRLIFPEGAHPLQPGDVNWEGCEYSKCGRTDKGVSAFGQVIGIRVRSNRPLGTKIDEPRAEIITEVGADIDGGGDFYNMIPDEEEQRFDTHPRENGIELMSPPLDPISGTAEDMALEELNLEDPNLEASLNFDPVADEIQYVALLNRLLPPDIRILAWCPSPPMDFSARFSCRERQYKYFFTQPAFSPTPHQLEFTSNNPDKHKDSWLNIEAMREAAKLFEGVHDFRNFCKIDGGKQLTNFTRRIYSADIEEVKDFSSALAHVNRADFIPAGYTPGVGGNPKVYTFNLNGSAFLWHQVRHMIAILFLVGQGLEKPLLVSELLDTDKNPRRPTYEMAIDTPLVLWDCIFPRKDDPERKDIIQWIYEGDGPGMGVAKYGSSGIMDDLWGLWREKKIDEMLAGTLISVVANQGSNPGVLDLGNGKRGSKSQKVFDGGDVPRFQGTYMPVMKKPLMESADEVNEKYANKKGFEMAEELKQQGWRKLRLTPGEES